MKRIKTFEAFGTNYSVENWTDFILYYIKTEITPKKIKLGKIGNESSFIIPIKSYTETIERYFTKKSFYDFPIKFIRLKFNISFTTSINKIYQASFTSKDDDIIMEKFKLFNHPYDVPTMKTMELSFHIKISETIWEESYEAPIIWNNLPELSSIIQHEVHHAYEEYEMSLNGVNPTKTKDSKLDTTIRNIWSVMPDTQLITKFIYLLTSHEINARITQLYRILKRNNVTTKEDFFDKIKNTITWKDYLILKNYEPSDYIKAFKHSFSDEEEKQFLNLWNELKDDKFPRFDSIEKFFTYWKPITESKSKKMKIKILKVWNLINQNY